MSDLEKSLAQEECKAIKTKMPTALVDKIGDGAPLPRSFYVRHSGIVRTAVQRLQHMLKYCTRGAMRQPGELR